MSETATSHEEHTSTSARIDGAPEALQIDKIDTLVGLRDRLLNEEHGDADGSRLLAEIDKYIADNGIDKDDPDQAELYTLAQKVALYAVDTRSEAEWLSSPTHDGTKQRRNIVYDEVFAHFPPQRLDLITDDESTTPEDDEPTTPEAGAEVLTLDELARRKHEAYNKKITGSSFGRHRRENMAAYEVAEAAYLEALERDLDEKIAELDPDMPEADRHAAISRLVNERATADDALQYDLLINSGSKRQRKMKKILAEYSGWSTKKKVLVGLGLGAGSFVAGFGLGLAAGAAGTVVAGVAAGKIGFSTFRTYYSRLSQNYHAPAETTGFEYQATDVTFGDQLRTFMTTTSRERIVSAEKVKKNATRWALGGLAVGATAASAGGILGTFQHTGRIDAPLTGNTWEGHSTPTNDHWKFGYLEDRFGGSADASRIATITPPGAGTGAGTEVIPPAAGNTWNAHEYVQDHNVGMTIHRGEGGYGLLQKHFDGISHDEAVKAWPDMAKDLDKKYPDFFYKHGSEWRIHMPSNGKLPTGLAEDMSQYLHDHNMLGGASGSAAEHAGGAGSIGRGEGIISELHQRGMENVTQAHVDAAGQALVKEGTGYVDPRIGGYGIYYDASPTDHTPAGQLTPGADRIFGDMADNGKLDNSYQPTGSTSEGVNTSTPDSVKTPSTSVDTSGNTEGTGYNGSELAGIKDALAQDATYGTHPDWVDMKKDIGSMRDLILQGNIDGINSNVGFQNTLDLVRQDLADITYPNSSQSIVTHTGLGSEGRWIINPVPNGSRIPPEALSILDKYQRAINARAA